MMAHVSLNLRYIFCIYIYIYLSIIPNSRSATKKSAAAVHDDNKEASNDDFNTMKDKKLNEFKSSVISELIKNMKV